jgi:hypothetical protein
VQNAIGDTVKQAVYSAASMRKKFEEADAAILTLA